MIYIKNSGAYPQRISIPRDDEASGVSHVIQFQEKDYDIDKNGEYYIYPDPGYDGITGGTINVHVPTDTQEAYDQGYGDGYSSGVTDGEQTQKAKLDTLTATTNGHYVREDGYRDVYVEVDTASTYSEGVQDGKAEQKALLTSTTFTENGHYERENGWNEVDVRLNLQSFSTAITENGRSIFQPPQGQSGWDSIEIDVQVPQTTGTTVLSALTATTNGTYYPAQYGSDGFSQVLVDVDTGTTSVLVPLTADTNQTYFPAAYSADGFSEVSVHVDTQPYYEQGYQDGEAAQRGKLKDITATVNNFTYVDQDGYSAVTVSVDTSGVYVSGYTDGMEAQKALLGTLSADTNGTYTSDTGYSAVTVNVQPTLMSVTLPVEAGDTQTYNASDFGVDGFDRVSVSGLYPSYEVMHVDFTTTAMNQTVTFTSASINSIPTNLKRVVVDSIGLDSDVRTITVETPGSYTARIFCASYSPIINMSDQAITDVTILSACTSIANVALGSPLSSSLNSIVFESGAKYTYIPYNFYGDVGTGNVTAVTIPDSIIEIGSRAFKDGSLNDVTIGNNVRNIGYKAFSGNHNLSAITSYSQFGINVASDTFDQVASNGTLYIPSGTTSAYTEMIAALPSGWTVSDTL